MRFKGEMSSESATDLCPLERVGQHCLINLTPRTFHVFLSHHYTHGEQAFVETPMETVFTEYEIKSKRNNEVAFLVNVGNFSRVCKSAEQAQTITLKLTKKGDKAYLQFTIDRDQIQIVQDLPIRIEPAKTLAEMQEPDVPAPDVRFRMPELKQLRIVIDRMKQISDVLEMSATDKGDLCIQVRTDLVTVKTFYKDLMLRTHSSGAAAAAAQQQLASAETAAGAPPHDASPQQPPSHPDSGAAAAMDTTADFRAAPSSASAGPRGPPAASGGAPTSGPTLVNPMIDSKHSHLQPQSQYHPPSSGSIPLPPSSQSGAAASTNIPQQPQPHSQVVVPASAAPPPSLDSKTAAAPATPATVPPSQSDCVVAHAKFDIKKFSNVLHARILDINHVIGCIIVNRAFVLYIKLKNKSTLTYYIPLLADE